MARQVNRERCGEIVMNGNGREAYGGRASAFIRGFGGMFSFIDVLNRRLFAESAAEADAEALREVWEEVGGNLYDAMGVYSVEYNIYPTRREREPCQTTPSGEKPLPE